MFQATAAKISAALIILALVATGSFAAGWRIKGWKNDSEQAAVDRASQAIIDKATANESGIAAKVEQRLSELKANETVIDRGIIREIQNPIYRNVCIADDGLRILNDIARGQAPADPGKPVGQVPGTAARAQ